MKSTTIFSFIFAFILFHSGTIFAQNTNVPSQEYHYLYTLKLQGDFTPGNGNSKVYVIKLRKLFGEVSVWYKLSENTFYVKTKTKTHTLEEYTEIIESHGGVFLEPITIENIEIDSSVKPQIIKQ